MVLWIHHISLHGSYKESASFFSESLFLVINGFPRFWKRDTRVQGDGLLSYVRLLGGTLEVSSLDDCRATAFGYSYGLISKVRTTIGVCCCGNLTIRKGKWKTRFCKYIGRVISLKKTISAKFFQVMTHRSYNSHA